MKLEDAVERILLGEPMQMLAMAYREELLDAFGLDADEVAKDTFAKDTRLFMNKLCRELGDRHERDNRAMVALRDWVSLVRDYEAWDALLANFDFESKETLILRGRVLFAGPMTAHWQT